MRATQIESSGILSQNVNMYAWKYFYYPIVPGLKNTPFHPNYIDATTDLSFIFKKAEGKANLCFYFENNGEYTLANTEFKSQCFSFSAGLNHMDITVTKDHFDEYAGGNLLVGVIGGTSTSHFISVQIGNDGSSNKVTFFYL